MLLDFNHFPSQNLPLTEPTNNAEDYERHVMSKHQLTASDVNHPCYPTKADIERLGLGHKAQGKSWEI
jgi:hypothetical protein